jgi:hypothetical protein
MKVNFKLPNTRFCVVIHIRGNQKQETLLETPRNNEALRNRMLERKVGYGEIRAVKAVDPEGLVKSMTRV